jgi:hypothetical protein
LIKNGQKLRGNFFVVHLRTTPAADGRLEILDRDVVTLVLRRFDEAE